jgi:NitT/TauT family transport system ATP-binding protein
MEAVTLDTPLTSAPAGTHLPPQPLLSIEHLCKSYKTRHGQRIEALKDINLTVGTEEFVTVVGPSGCGKSTLLKILAGLERRSFGSVRFGGRELDGPTRQVGLVFQAPVLLAWRTVLDNVMLPIEVQRRNRAAHLDKAHALLAMAGLEGFANRYPFELSGGMQQRVSICRALIHDPSFLLMDEPFGALDAMNRETMNLELLRIWKDSRKTAMLVTHSIPEAVFLADRVVAMSPRPGRIVENIPIDLPRPRTLEMFTSKAFGRHVSHIRDLFNSSGNLDA